MVTAIAPEHGTPKPLAGEPGASAPAASPPAASPPAAEALLDVSIVSPEIPKSIVRVTATLTGLCIVFALALCALVIVCAMQQRASELMIRLLMSCVACFVGLAFASLGFGLFLLRARGGFRARIDGAGTPNVPPALLESTAPGLVVVVCATIVMWLALRIRFEITSDGDGITTSRFNHAVPAKDDAVPRDPPSPARPAHLSDGVSPP
jgi:hypothetical protein